MEKDDAVAKLRSLLLGEDDWESPLGKARIDGYNRGIHAAIAAIESLHSRGECKPADCELGRDWTTPQNFGGPPK